MTAQLKPEVEIRARFEAMKERDRLKDHVCDQIINLFVDNGITVNEAESIMEAVAHDAARKAKKQTFSELYMENDENAG